MSNVRLIALNPSGGAQVTVVATRTPRLYSVIEDESVTPQGLIYQTKDDSFTGVFQVGPATEPLIFGNLVAHGGGKGPIQGYPAQNSSGNFNFIPATPLWKGNSASAIAGTSIRFTEID